MTVKEIIDLTQLSRRSLSYLWGFLAFLLPNLYTK